MRPRVEGTCWAIDAEGPCDRAANYFNGLCRKHHHRVLRTGSVVLKDRSPKVCAAPGCTKLAAKGRTICCGCRSRMRDRGTFDPPIKVTVAERLWAGIEQAPTGCWLWTRGQDGSGYGRIYKDGKQRAVHRVMHELVIGPIPEAYEVDHLCYVRACVNPAHLEAVTKSENIRRELARCWHGKA